MQAKQSYQTRADLADLREHVRGLALVRGAGWWVANNPAGVLLRNMKAPQLEALAAAPDLPPPPPTREESLARLANRYKRAAARGDVATQERAASAILDLVLT